MRDFEVLHESCRHRDFPCELWTRSKSVDPRVDARMQPRERIPGKRKPVRVDKPSDVEHAQSVAHQIGTLRQPFVELLELGAEFLRRSARPLIAEAFPGGAFPEFDLNLPSVILAAPHRTRAVKRIALERLGGLWRSGRREHEPEA